MGPREAPRGSSQASGHNSPRAPRAAFPEPPLRRAPHASRQLLLGPWDRSGGN